MQGRNVQGYKISLADLAGRRKHLLPLKISLAKFLFFLVVIIAFAFTLVIFGSTSTIII